MKKIQKKLPIVIKKLGYNPWLGKDNSLYALCNDGNVWYFTLHGNDNMGLLTNDFYKNHQIVLF